MKNCQWSVGEIQEIKNTRFPFEKYLQYIHALEYTGTDDDMPDAFDAWIVELDHEKLIEHANVFGRLLQRELTNNN